MPVIQHSETALASWDLRQRAKKANLLRNFIIFNQSQQKTENENTNLHVCLILSGGNPQIIYIIKIKLIGQIVCKAINKTMHSTLFLYIFPKLGYYF